MVIFSNFFVRMYFFLCFMAYYFPKVIFMLKEEDSFKLYLEDATLKKDKFIEAHNISTSRFR